MRFSRNLIKGVHSPKSTKQQTWHYNYCKKDYLCTIENMIETFMKEEQAIFIVALFLLLFAIIMS